MLVKNQVLEKVKGEEISLLVLSVGNNPAVLSFSEL
jgi:hypothetical protein